MRGVHADGQHGVAGRTQIAPRFYFCLRKVEGDGHPCVVDDDRTETFAQLMARLMDTYGVNESQIARALELNPSTVYKWTSGERAGQRGPRADTLRKIHNVFPKFSEHEIFAAVGRQTPARMDLDAEQRVLELYRELTAEQQRSKLIEMRALGEANRSAG